MNVVDLETLSWLVGGFLILSLVVTVFVCKGFTVLVEEDPHDEHEDIAEDIKMVYMKCEECGVVGMTSEYTEECSVCHSADVNFDIELNRDVKI